MDASFPKEYMPSQGFVEDTRDPLIDLNLTDSTELWLIQWPINQNPDFNELHASLNLRTDGDLGTLKDSSGISYDVVSSTLRDPQPVVILPSSSDVKIVGKISRRVQLINFPEPGEIHTWGRRPYTSLSASSSRHLPMPTRTIKPRYSEETGGYSSQLSKNKRSRSGSASGGSKSKASPGVSGSSSPSSNRNKKAKHSSASGDDRK